MDRNKFSEYKILIILKEANTGISIEEICKKYQICPQTFNKWKEHYKNLKAPMPKRIQKLEEINQRLRDLYNQVCRDKQPLREAVE